jgi:hypothetical protein
MNFLEFYIYGMIILALSHFFYKFIWPNHFQKRKFTCEDCGSIQENFERKFFENESHITHGRYTNSGNIDKRYNTQYDTVKVTYYEVKCEKCNKNYIYEFRPKTISEYQDEDLGEILNIYPITYNWFKKLFLSIFKIKSKDNLENKNLNKYFNEDEFKKNLKLYINSNQNINNDPELKRLDNEFQDLVASTRPRLLQIKKEKPEIWALLVKGGLVPEDYN